MPKVADYTVVTTGVGSPDYTQQINFGPKSTQTILTEASIAALGTSLFTDCTPLNLVRKYIGGVLTIKATYDAAATQGVRIHVFSSADGITWDTVDYDTWLASFTAGAAIVTSKPYDTLPAYLAVQVENLDPARPVTLVSAAVTSGA